MRNKWTGGRSICSHESFIYQPTLNSLWSAAMHPQSANSAEGTRTEGLTIAEIEFLATKRQLCRKPDLQRNQPTLCRRACHDPSKAPGMSQQVQHRICSPTLLGRQPVLARRYQRECGCQDEPFRMYSAPCSLRLFTASNLSLGFDTDLMRGSSQFHINQSNQPGRINMCLPYAYRISITD